MAITPTVLIAAKGLISGDALGVSPKMTEKMNIFGNNNMMGAISDYMPDGLPDFMSQGPTQVTKLQKQASMIMPSGPGVDPAAAMKQFAGVFNQSAAFGTAGAEWGAALKQFQGKSFTDIAPNFGKMSDVNTNGLSNMFSGALGNVPSLPPGMVPADLLKDSMAKLGASMKGMGTMFDPGNLGKMSDPLALVANLQKQGLGDIGGLNERLYEAGIENIEDADPETVKRVLAKIQGEDLKRLMKNTGFSPTGQVTDLSQILDAKNILPSNLLSALPGGDLGGLANGLGNLGGNFKSFDDVSNMMKSMDVPQLSSLDALTKPLPDDVFEEFKDLLGEGDGPFGNPTMGDLLGSVSGKGHMEGFGEMGLALQKMSGSGISNSLLQSGGNLANAVAAARANAIANGIPESDEDQILTYIDTDPAVISAKADMDAAGQAFSQQMANNLDLKSLTDKANAAFSSIKDQLDKEQRNFGEPSFKSDGSFDKLVGGKAGIDLSAIPKSNTSILAMAGNLHNFGVDKLNLGFGEMFSSMALPGISGEAIQAALQEGRNRAKMVAVGISLPGTAIPDQQAVQAAQESLPGVRAERDSARSEFESIQRRVQKANQSGGVTDALSQELELARSKLDKARGAVTAAERTAGVDFT